MSWGCDISIHITDDAFKRMMDDNDFKDRMLSKIREDASVSGIKGGGERRYEREVQREKLDKAYEEQLYLKQHWTRKERASAAYESNIMEAALQPLQVSAYEFSNTSQQNKGVSQQSSIFQE